MAGLREWVLAGLVASLSGPAAMTASAFAAPPAEIATPRIRPRVVSETMVKSNAGLDYRIRVSAPQGSAPGAGFPVIYVLDGDAWFGAAAEIARIREWTRLPPAVIVGVGYPEVLFFDAERRLRDFTPPGSVDPGSDGPQLGGADDFLAFLQQTLKPWVHANHRVDPDQETLFGHSLGGLFVLHTLFTQPSAFDTYIAASPSLGFSGGIALRHEARFVADPHRTRPRLLLTMGEYESRPSPGQLADYRRYFTENPKARDGQSVEAALAALFPVAPGPDRSEVAAALVERLSRAGVRASFARFEGEEHTSSAVNALNRGLPFALRRLD